MTTRAHFHLRTEADTETLQSRVIIKVTCSFTSQFQSRYARCIGRRAASVLDWVTTRVARTRALTAGYATMCLLALLPPLWRWIMDPRVEAWRALNRTGPAIRVLLSADGKETGNRRANRRDGGSH